MGFFSSIASFTAKAVSAVVKVATKTYEAAKQVVGKAIGFMATNAEKLVEDIKETWTRVKRMWSCSDPMYNKRPPLRPCHG